MEVEEVLTDEDGGRRPRQVETAVADRGCCGGWRHPWLDGGGRGKRRLLWRMEVAVANGTAPLANGGDSGRAAAADGVAPVVGEGGRGRVAAADGSSHGGGRRRWRIEAALRAWRRPW